MKKIVLLAALISALSFTSCSDDDGDWTPMKWQTSVIKEKDGSITVPSQGGSYIFVCTNYNSPWTCSVAEYVNGTMEYAEHIYDDNWKGFITPYLDAEWQDNILTVTVSPNTTGKERTMMVEVTAGDIFDDFTFKQVAAE